MEGTIGEIRGFAGNFAPANWALCQGQTLPIAQYTALFSILGTTYGGDGQTNFQLPNIQSRIVIGAGAGQGLPVYNPGDVLGEENHTLTINEMPAHTHTVTAQNDSTPPSATVNLMGINATGNKINPAANLLAQDELGKTLYAPGTSTTVAMNAGSLVLNSITMPVPTVTVNMAGQSQPHSNIQPVLGVNYIICLEGIFPSRN
jgi:microcystin-dependent protein